MMKRKHIVGIAIALGASLALHVGGTFLIAPDATNVYPAGSSFRSPEFVGKMFGPTVAAAFPAFVLFICTVLGIAAHVFHEPKSGFNKHVIGTLFRALLISPIVLFATYAAAIDQPDGFVAALMAFENGFFWKAIFDRRQSTATAKGDSP
jgi:hypothetical protein